jgi:hypothetical protein
VQSAPGHQPRLFYKECSGRQQVPKSGQAPDSSNYKIYARIPEAPKPQGCMRLPWYWWCPVLSNPWYLGHNPMGTSSGPEPDEFPEASPPSTGPMDSGLLVGMNLVRAHSCLSPRNSYDNIHGLQSLCGTTQCLSRLNSTLGGSSQRPSITKLARRT